ncbi:hypothetical protein ACRQFN_09270 [Actinotignum sp. GS-2025e]|uniref:hypothetical protein n=1 Tax=unclassified Actinotignum TaxID=2632702 RepID=UPI003F489B58
MGKHAEDMPLDPQRFKAWESPLEQERLEKAAKKAKKREKKRRRPWHKTWWPL